ncbi:MAG: glycosyltransferase family 1 protein [Oscillatoriales cyanobacterium C42_A2020_001]|nr:glycosyltransferase family 1 protein [Leptolyngbyaceae cyanobacterium C42_A2020_001]
MKAFIIGNADPRIDRIAAVQLDPFFVNRKRLSQILGFTFRHIQAVSIAEITQACKRVDPDVDVLFIRPDWRENPDQVLQALKTIRALHPNRKIFFIDPWDQVSSRFFGVLPYVDRFLKYQRLKDIQKYRQPLLGGTVITDYLAKEWGFDLRDWSVSSAIPQGYEHRIATGWNVVTGREYERTLFQPLWWKVKHRKLRRKPKNIDVFCHVSYGSIHDSHNWYTDYRMVAVEAVKRLGAKYRLAVSGEYPERRTVSKERYQDEIERSRIVVSPFGWGETTWRDYEAVCNHCLLVKPRMEHIDTAPSIYYPNETYVPIEWDFSDLEETCSYYLHNPDEAARIITNARRILENYFKQGEFVKAIAHLLADQPLPLGKESPALPPPLTFPVA